MVNKLVDGIVRAISAAFGDEYEIYTEPVTQNLTPPCFLVETVQPEYEHYFWKRYREKVSFCIHYFPKGPDAAEECNAVFDRLTDCLEYITVEDRLIRGTGMKAEFPDGEAMHFLVDYEVFLQSVDETDKMGDYSLEMEVRGEKDFA